MRTHLALGLLSLLLMCATPAHGQDESASRDQAETLVENGIRFARSGDFDAAIEQFEAALKLYPSAEIMHSLARAHEEAKHLSKAHSWFGKALSTTPNYLYAEDARERMYAIESRLRKTHALLHVRSTPAQARVSITAGEHKARHLVAPISWWVPAGSVKLSGERSGFEPRDESVTVQAGEVRTLELVLTPIEAKGFLTVTATEVGATVKVDGQVVGKTPIGTLTLTEGTHVIEVQAPGGLPILARTVTILADKVAPAVAFNLSEPVAPSAGGKNRFLWAGLSFGGSLGLTVLGAVFHAKYTSKGEEANELWLEVDSSNKVGDASAAQIASDKADDAWGEAEAAQLRMLACYGLGGALVGLGLYMLATDGAPEPSPSSEGTSWVPTLSISDDHVGLGAHLRF